MSNRRRWSLVAAFVVVALGGLGLLSLRNYMTRQEAQDLVELAFAQLSPAGASQPLDDLGRDYHAVLRSRTELVSYLCARAVDLDPTRLKAAHYVLGLFWLSADCELAREHLEAAVSSGLKDARIDQIIELAKENRCGEVTKTRLEPPPSN